MPDMNIDTRAADVDWQQIAGLLFLRNVELESLVEALKASHRELQATAKHLASTPVHPSSRVTH